MSAAPFDIGPVIDRLKEKVPELRLVGTAAEYDTVRSLGDFPVPCAYVILATEQAVETKPGISLRGQQQPMAQAMSVGFGVVMVFRNYRGLEGNELRDELRQVVGQVRNPLLGWTPPVDGGRQCQLFAGELEDYDASTAMWLDKWKTQHIIKPEISA